MSRSLSESEIRNVLEMRYQKSSWFLFFLERSMQLAVQKNSRLQGHDTQRGRGTKNPKEVNTEVNDRSCKLSCPCYGVFFFTLTGAPRLCTAGGSCRKMQTKKKTLDKNRNRNRESVEFECCHHVVPLSGRPSWVHFKKMGTYFMSVL